MTRYVAWLLGTLVWIAVIVYLARQGWPHMPLDVPASDPQVRAALQKAVTAHLLRYGGLALIPPALALVVLKASGRAGGQG